MAQKPNAAQTLLKKFHFASKIKRCTDPFFGYLNKDDYAKQMNQARRFLSGESAQIQADYARRMHDAA